MNHKRAFTWAAVTALIACGGGEQPETAPAASTPSSAAPRSAPAPPSGPMTTPAWLAVNVDARTVSMTITAGATPDNNYWNYNGAINGDLAVTVPEGFTVSIEFVNRDPIMAHSLGVSSETSSFSLPPAPNPVFPGAISQSPTSMLDGTLPGETEILEFVADAAGTYTLVCYIAGHSAVGMWIYFIVDGGGRAGVQTRGPLAEGS
jgi:FtsP/CotA-like multicopper oxidase with cupredoxin domain